LLARPDKSLVKRLILSLIFAVIASTIGAGWVINQFHSTVYNNTSNADKNIAAYKQLGKVVGMTLDDLSYQREFIESWAASSNLSISTQDLTEFPVPENLSKDFTNGTPLLLESDGEMSLHVYMKKTDRVMTIILPVQNGNKKQPLLSLILTLLFYFVVIVVLLAWLYPLVKRLVVLQKTTAQFGKGNLNSRIALSKNSYIFEIEKEFNRMADRR